MTSFRRIASVLALATISAVGLPGCIIGDCEDGQDNCISLESGTFYTSTDDETVSYTAGQNLVIKGFNGSIEIEDGAATGQIEIEAQRRTLGESSDEGEEAAKLELEEDIRVSITKDGEVRVVTERLGNNGNLAVNLTVRLPDEFNGAVTVDQNNGAVDLDLRSVNPTAVTVTNDGAGDVDVDGAQGTLNIQGGFDVSVSIAVWPTDAGSITSDGQLGDVTLAVPTVANGSISAMAGDAESLILPATLPETWADNGGGSITLGDGSGGAVTVAGPKTITLQ